MALEFRPPQDLINAYLSRPSPGQQASDAINTALTTYAQSKAASQKAQNDALKSYIDAFNAGGTTLATDVATRMGLKNPPTLPGSIPPIASSSTLPSPQANPMAVTPTEEAAQQSLPSEHPIGVPDQAKGISPIVQASLAAGHPNHSGLQLPSPEDPVALANMGAYGTKKLTALEGVQKLIDKQKADAEKADEMGPKSFDYARTFASNAGAPTAADGFIKIAKSEGRNTLTKREMDDLNKSISASVQKGRGDFYETTGRVREQTLRDSLIKEARTTLDPYFQSGEGKQQAQRLNRIDRASALIDQMKGQAGGGDTRQMRELATSLASVLTGGNVVAEQQINELVPQTYKGNLNKFIEKLSNNPTGLDQQAFVQRLSDTLTREKTTIQKQARTVAERTAPTLRVLKSNYPEDYDAVVNQYLQNSPEIMGANPGTTPPQSAGPHGPTVTQNGHTYTWNGSAYE